MLTVERLEDLPALEQPLHLALGVFDGVHLGHQEVISRAVRAAKSEGGLAGVVTFHPHPCRAVRPDQAPPSILATLEHKALLVEELGIGLFVPVRFDQSLANMPATDFLDLLTRGPVKTVAVGEDWRFGRDRAGNVGMLAQEAPRRGYRLEAVEAVLLDGERISSTRIREWISTGDLAAASRMLGRPYSLRGDVLHGDKLGRTIGFPTANLFTGDAQLPPDGVWAVRVRLPDGRLAPGVANLGLRPTVDGSSRRLEVHLFDFSGDLYGQALDVRFESRIRSEQTFANLESLKQQIQLDCTAARAMLQ